MKAIIIGLLIALAVFDILLIMGCAKLERMRENEDGSTLDK